MTGEETVIGILTRLSRDRLGCTGVSAERLRCLPGGRLELRQPRLEQLDVLVALVEKRVQIQAITSLAGFSELEMTLHQELVRDQMGLILERDLFQTRASLAGPAGFEQIAAQGDARSDVPRMFLQPRAQYLQSRFVITASAVFLGQLESPTGRRIAPPFLTQRVDAVLIRLLVHGVQTTGQRGQGPQNRVVVRLSGGRNYIKAPGRSPGGVGSVPSQGPLGIDRDQLRETRRLIC